MLKSVKKENVLFLDIETVPMAPAYELCPKHFRDLWDKKSVLISKQDSFLPEALWQRAGIYAEFGKIVCISTAIISGNQVRVRSFSGHSERDLLIEFINMLDMFYNGEHHLLCAHNGKEFDFPYLSRRMIINDLPLPGALRIAGLKPWQIRHLDTMELWKFGDYKSFTSLELLSACLGIPSPKDDISGEDVHRVYWQEMDLPRIVHYCMRDTVTVVCIFLKYMGMSLPKEEDIVYC